MSATHSGGEARKHFGFAQDIRRNALLAEVARLKPLLPDTDACRRNVAAIEKQRPPEKMDEAMLSNYVDLLTRSVPSPEGAKP